MCVLPALGHRTTAPAPACDPASWEDAPVPAAPLQNSPELPRYADELCEARKKKNISRELALDSLEDFNVYGTLMVRCGDADGMVSGATTTTASTIRPALQASAGWQQAVTGSWMMHRAAWRAVLCCCHAGAWVAQHACSRGCPTVRIGCLCKGFTALAEEMLPTP